MADLSIDVTQLKTLSADLRRVSPTLQKEFLKELGRAGDVVASAAKVKASSFSGANRTDRIAKSIKVRRRGVSVRVIAGGPGAPEAAPINNAGLGGTFRHPVFGKRDDPWRSQPAHPFLQPALEENVLEVDALIFAAVDDAFIVGGFR